MTGEFNSAIATYKGFEREILYSDRILARYPDDRDLTQQEWRSDRGEGFNR